MELLVFLRMTAHNAAPMLSRILTAALLFATPVLAQPEPSQPPTPSDTVENQGEENEAGPQSAAGTDQSSGAGITITNAPVIQVPTGTADQGAENDDEDSSGGWPVLVTAVATAVIAVFTVILAIVGRKQRETLEAQRELQSWALKHEQVSDRGWINIETLDIEPSNGGRAIFVGLKNSGRTPVWIKEANITVRSTVERKDEGGGTVIEHLSDLPEDPVYDTGEFVPPSMLVAGETTRWKHSINTVTNSAFDVLTTHPGEDAKFWIYGFVHYTEQFHPSKVRRYGWAREYDPVLSKREGRFKFAHMSKKKYSYAD